MDGKVLTEIFTGDWLKRNPPRQCKPDDAGECESGSVLDEAEAGQIEERLRGLGYIE
jgi:hypothetical protein